MRSKIVSKPRANQLEGLESSGFANQSLIKENLDVMFKVLRVLY
jgi:hypothetical protein